MDLQWVCFTTCPRWLWALWQLVELQFVEFIFFFFLSGWSRLLTFSWQEKKEESEQQSDAAGQAACFFRLWIYFCFLKKLFTCCFLLICTRPLQCFWDCGHRWVNDWLCIFRCGWCSLPPLPVALTAVSMSLVFCRLARGTHSSVDLPATVPVLKRVCGGG